MNNQEKAESTKQALNALFIIAGPLDTEDGARYHVRRHILQLLEEYGYDQTYHLANDFKRDCKAQAGNERETPETRAQYAAQALAWEEFCKLFNGTRS